MTSPKIPIAAITTVRNDDLFLPKWISYYGSAFGFRNLYIFLDGHDQVKPDCDGAELVNFIQLPFQPLERAKADRRRARIMSHLARGLFWLYDSVLAMDVDEFLVVDPQINTPLADYLHQQNGRPTLSGLGLDVGQHMSKEQALDPSQAFLKQRKHAQLSSRYTKPIVANQPVTWGSGMHRVKGGNFYIDPNLYLFHFGMVDFLRSTDKTSDADRLAAGWESHLQRRHSLFKIITHTEPQCWDSCIDTARTTQQRKRQLFSWNKPKLLAQDQVVIIPDRFQDLI